MLWVIAFGIFCCVVVFNENFREVRVELIGLVGIFSFGFLGAVSVAYWQENPPPVAAFSYVGTETLVDYQEDNEDRIVYSIENEKLGKIVREGVKWESEDLKRNVNVECVYFKKAKEGQAAVVHTYSCKPVKHWGEWLFLLGEPRTWTYRVIEIL